MNILNSYKQLIQQPSIEDYVNEATKDQHQRLALKDLEIMRLREALENTVLSLKGYRMELSDNQPCDAEKAAVLVLSTPTTYDDLMAWHEAQLGEPVSWINVKDKVPKNDKTVICVEIPVTFISAFESGNYIPACDEIFGAVYQNNQWLYEPDADYPHVAFVTHWIEIQNSTLRKDK